MYQKLRQKMISEKFWTGLICGSLYSGIKVCHYWVKLSNLSICNFYNIVMLVLVQLYAGKNRLR